MSSRARLSSRAKHLSSRAKRGICFFLLAVALACSAPPRPGRYELVSMNGRPLPFRSDTTPNGCMGSIAGGWFQVDVDGWYMADSVHWQCASSSSMTISPRFAPGLNLVHHSRDTLNFVIADSATDPGFLAYSGIIRHDSLYVIETYADSPPRRVYVRRGSR